jgi:hypothetical protein
LPGAEALRDRYLRAWAAPRDDGERARLRDELASAADPPALLVEGLEASFRPSARLSEVRLVDEALIEPAWRPSFARPSVDMPHLLAAFVDPEELHFRTFENIIPLDRWFARAPLDLALAPPARLDARYDTFAAPLLTGAEALLALDGLGLYAPPRDGGARGGRRFIFHSAKLGAALTRAVRAALPPDVLVGFSHVNPVFRFNRFEPGEAGFHGHFDSPYYDAARGHISRYTLLLYLTGGRGSPALRVEGASVPAIAPATCVLFDQRYEHAGGAYAEGPKVFLRTELVFADASLGRDARAGAWFAKACYLTGESAFDGELAAQARAHYDRAAAAHWGGPSGGAEGVDEPFVHKCFRGAHFVTNGCDYWFARGAGSLRECAALALFDYFNCKIDGRAFRKLCRRETLRRRGASWVGPFLEAFGPPPTPVFGRLDKEALFPPPEDVDPRACCPDHVHERTLCHRVRKVVDAYAAAQARARALIMPAPLLMLGQEVFLDPERFVVTESLIHVLSSDVLAPLNFAGGFGCWEGHGGANCPADYLDVELTVDAPRLLVPPIAYVERPTHCHLMLDVFRNAWAASYRPQAVGVPKVDESGDRYGRASDEGEPTLAFDEASRYALRRGAGRP